MNDCGCDCHGHEPEAGRPVIRFCPTHAQAPAMLALLRRLTDPLTGSETRNGVRVRLVLESTWTEARALLRAVESS